ncbi:MAG: DoxX family membrane protein, partial [Gemmatimonadaceae bacterium]|nr:DoxX family membrane protein [Gemmatimonadaceae bacterium]
MSNARGVTLLFLRISLGLLMIIWGADKLVNPAHGIVVAERFYFGLMSSASFMPALGIAEILLGLMVIAGILRQYSYVLLAIVTGITLVGVWRSVLD